MRLFFLDLESDEDIFDDKSDNDGSGSGFTIGSGLSALCPFFEISFDRVCGLSCDGVVKGSVQWIDVPQPFFETGVATADWTENIYVNPWFSVDISDRSPDNPINLQDVVRRVRDDILNDDRVERFQNISREIVARCLLDICDDVMSDDDWLESDWSD